MSKKTKRRMAWAEITATGHNNHLTAFYNGAYQVSVTGDADDLVMTMSPVDALMLARSLIYAAREAAGNLVLEVEDAMSSIGQGKP